MARYIDADTLLEFVKNNTPTIDGQTTMKCVERAIKEAPTADVVDVTKVVEMLCKIKTNIIKNVSTMIENDFSEIVKDALGERRTDND